MVRARLRIGGLLSGALLIAGVVSSGIVVLTVPWWVGALLGSVDGVATAFAALLVGVLVLGLPFSVAVLAGIRPGNAALRRRVLAMDGEGVWVYESELWWTAPRLVPWKDVGRVRAFTEESADVDAADTGPSPTLVPWDYLTFGDPSQAAVHLLWLTATAEEIVVQARARRPDLVFLDERKPPAPGFGGWILRRRRQTRGTRS
ncbi:hypothetical protein HUO13_29545 [Saccharopolyspora erythraea]|uniref:hypothetical protein n=1 Tax=Saccharopolyspora erythraea TaxID=1836 RepID=UPI001BAD7107|nr:hypothetical protein [Saccharopolyspora erythraea]QUH04371.1 hypothetical protein HUO13_29545 [Saccharopolyspora erythraea]